MKYNIRNSHIGNDMYELIKELYPICRSITGNGVRQSLKIIQKHIPLQIHEVPSDTKVLDWTVPFEWNIKNAYIKNSKGEKVVDFQKSNLHIVNYSIPIKKKVTLQELKKHLFTLPNHPDWIPYRTTYYKKDWGFCMKHRDYIKLEDDTYEVVIDSSLEKGSLTYGEYFLKGETEDEILISAHICHPSLCNDNLSGVSLATFLAKSLQGLKLRYSYRFLFIPGTIGSIMWLAKNESLLSRIRHGLVITGVGDRGNITYKRSRKGNTEIDRTFEQVLKHSGSKYQVLDFYPYGYDERQYCSPGFNLPVGTFMRSQHGTYPEYHTSADNLRFIKKESLSDSFLKVWKVLDTLEHNISYINLYPKGEPQLGRRGIYDAMAQQDEDVQKLQYAMLWVLNLSDGTNSLLDIADKSGLSFHTIKNAADILLKHQLLKEKI